ncbi:MAG TPA: NAD(P)-dependent oxidoreductase [Anaeromyxobacteraceae bacterium]|nr:NAD(P)-dependent oxidoreductase [Anaeromyxobacteraceae bacterium]
MSAIGRVVVTGAAGFVGAATVRALLRTGAEVIAWVRPGTDRWRLAGLAEHPRLRLLRSDLAALTEPGGRAAAAETLGTFRPDAVLHAAWSGIRGAARDDPAQVGNVLVATELVKLAAEAGAARFVGVGSQAEYGPYPRPIREDDCTRPASLYGAAKLAAGQLSLALARHLGIGAAWARLFSVYGPGERGGALVPDLVHALAEGRRFPLGPCRQLWDWLYEDDAAEALALLALRRGAEGLFNVASGRPRPLEETVRMVAGLVAPGAAVPLGERPGPEQDLVADVGRIAAALAWTPRVDLPEGLRLTVAALLGRSHGGAAHREAGAAREEPS